MVFRVAAITAFVHLNNLSFTLAINFIVKASKVIRKLREVKFLIVFQK
jgi:hypothetical protein